MLSLDRYAEAERLFRAALAAAERTLDPGDGDIGLLLNNVGKALAEQGRHAAARPYFERALPIAAAAHGAQSSAYARILSNAADAMLGAGERQEAEALYRQALAVLLANDGPDHPWTIHAQRRLETLSARPD